MGGWGLMQLRCLIALALVLRWQVDAGFACGAGAVARAAGLGRVVEVEVDLLQLGEVPGQFLILLEVRVVRIASVASLLPIVRRVVIHSQV